jgi:hypothetical protein
VGNRALHTIGGAAMGADAHDIIKRINANPAAYYIFVEDWIDENGVEHVDELAILDKTTGDAVIDVAYLGDDRELFISLFNYAQYRGRMGLFVIRRDWYDSHRTQRWAGLVSVAL